MNVNGSPRSMELMGNADFGANCNIVVNTSTHEIVAAEVTLSNLTDVGVLPNLLKQTRRKVIELSGDGIYDTRNLQDEGGCLLRTSASS